MAKLMSKQKNTYKLTSIKCILCRIFCTVYYSFCLLATDLLTLNSINDFIDFYGNKTKKNCARVKDIDSIMPKFESVLPCNSFEAP